MRNKTPGQAPAKALPPVAHRLRLGFSEVQATLPCSAIGDFEQKAGGDQRQGSPVVRVERIRGWASLPSGQMHAALSLEPAGWPVGASHGGGRPEPVCRIPRSPQLCPSRGLDQLPGGPKPLGNYFGGRHLGRGW